MAATNAQSGSASLEDVFGKNPSAWTTSHTPAQPTHKPHPKLAHAHTHAVADLNVQSNSARNWNGCSILPPKREHFLQHQEYPKMVSCQMEVKTGWTRRIAGAKEDDEQEDKQDEY